MKDGAQIYIAACEDWRIVKVGISANVGHRIVGLRAYGKNKYGCNIVLRKVFPDGTLDKERIMRHSVPMKPLEGREWGLCLPETKSVVESITRIPKAATYGNYWYCVRCRHYFLNISLNDHPLYCLNCKALSQSYRGGAKGYTVEELLRSQDQIKALFEKYGNHRLVVSRDQAIKNDTAQVKRERLIEKYVNLPLSEKMQWQREGRI